MTPYFSDAWLDIYQGDVRAVLPELASDSVDCIVTSPPYWGLRDYGSDGQLGLERTPEEYVANMVAVFRELRRVLKPSGTCWLNLGDSYASNWGMGAKRDSSWWSTRSGELEGKGWGDVETAIPPNSFKKGRADGLKVKDLVGIPWRVAFALQADGWYLRSDIIWAKPNPMPESVTDRPTKAHEYLFLLTKAARYYYDADAVREAPALSSVERGHLTKRQSAKGDVQPETHATNGHGLYGTSYDYGGRNLRSVWTIATRPYPGAHFAVFPPELPERCIKAGSSERGVCPDCGAPWERVTERPAPPEVAVSSLDRYGTGKAGVHRKVGEAYQKWLDTNPKITTGWEPTCLPNDEYVGSYSPQPAVVLDPFAGSGTTGMVANRLSRRAILIDLNGDYLKQQLARNAQTPLGLAG